VSLTLYLPRQTRPGTRPPELRTHAALSSSHSSFPMSEWACATRRVLFDTSFAGGAKVQPPGAQLTVPGKASVFSRWVGDDARQGMLHSARLRAESRVQKGTRMHARKRALAHGPAQRPTGPTPTHCVCVHVCVHPPLRSSQMGSGPRAGKFGKSPPPFRKEDDRCVLVCVCARACGGWRKGGRSACVWRRASRARPRPCLRLSPPLSLPTSLPTLSLPTSFSPPTCCVQGCRRR
jgi:hypothetical protein